MRIAPDEDAMATFEKRVARVEALGFFHEELVNAAEIKQLVPAYAGNCKGGIVARLDGHALPAQTLRAFFNAACSEGVEPFTRCKVTDISHGKDGFTVMAEDGRFFKSEIVINSAGAWGQNIAALMDDHLPIEPAGLSMTVTARMERFLTPVIGVHGRKLSFKQMTNGTVVIGGGHRAFLDMERKKPPAIFPKVKKSGETVTNISQ